MLDKSSEQLFCSLNRYKYWVQIYFGIVSGFEDFMGGGVTEDGFVTAWATVGLFIATSGLSYLTWVLARASRNPFVVAVIKENLNSLNHLDLQVINEGNSSAFDVVVNILPSDKLSKFGYPDKFAILHAGQLVVSYLGDAAPVLNGSFHVEVSWKRSPNSWKRTSIKYPIEVSYLEKTGRLGYEPSHEIASELKKIRESVVKVFDGRRRIKVDSFSHDDRDREAAITEEALKRVVRLEKARNGNPD